MGEWVKAGDVELWVERRGRDRRPPDRRAGRPGRGVAATARRPRRPLSPHRLRQPRGGAHGDARGAALGGDHGRRRRGAAEGARGADRPRRRLLDGQRNRAGAGASAPAVVRSLVLVGTYARPDALWRAQLNFWRWLAAVRQRPRLFEAFFTWVYTPRAHADGSVDQIIEEAMAFPHQSSSRPFKHRSTSASRTTPQTGCRRSACRRSSWPASSTRSCRRASVRRRGGDPERAIRGHARRGAPALPGGSGRVQRPRRRLLARGRGATLN